MKPPIEFFGARVELSNARIIACIQATPVRAIYLPDVKVEMEKTDDPTVALRTQLRAMEARIEALRRSPEFVDAPPEFADAPPEVAELLLRFCARANRDQFFAGDISEAFHRDCAQYGRAKAARLYWSEVAGYLFRLSFRWAAIVGAIKKLFTG
jgi:hypothetical protein